MSYCEPGCVYKLLFNWSASLWVVTIMVSVMCTYSGSLQLVSIVCVMCTYSCSLQLVRMVCVMCTYSSSLQLVSTVCVMCTYSGSLQLVSTVYVMCTYSSSLQLVSIVCVMCTYSGSLVFPHATYSDTILSVHWTTALPTGTYYCHGLHTDNRWNHYSISLINAYVVSSWHYQHSYQPLVTVNNEVPS